MSEILDDHPIQFYAENVEIPSFVNENRLQKWLTSLINSHQKNIGFINFIFCDDEYLLQINREYLGHDYYTDIITFPYRQDDLLESDIFISLDTVLDNAQVYHIDFQQELLRVIVHGVLHLLGHNDKSPDDASAMRKAEDEAILMYHSFSR